MLKLAEAHQVHPSKSVFGCRLWINSAGRANNASPHVKEAKQVVEYKKSLVQTVVVHLPLLKLNSVKILDYLWKLKKFKQPQASNPNTVADRRVSGHCYTYYNLIWNACNQSDVKVKTLNPASVVKQKHLLPGFVEVNSNKPSSYKIKNHQNFTDYLQQVPDASRLSNNTKEEKCCEEVVGLY